MTPVIAIPVAGRDLMIEPTMALARRLEAVIGPLFPFAAKLDAAEVALGDIARVYGLLFRGYPDPPSQAELDAWVWEQGAHAHQRLAYVLAAMTLGSAVLERQLMKLQASIDAAESAHSQPEGGPQARGPFSQATGQGLAASTGRG